MHAIRSISTIFTKEIWLQNRFRLSLLSHLLVGPLISALPIAFVYGGLFHRHADLQLGDLTRQNYAAFLIFGFLIHTCLNSGYYCLSTRILHEWWYQTLPLHWAAPCHPVSLVIGWTSLDFLKCLLLTLIAFFLLAFKSPLSLTFLLAASVTLFSLYLFGMALGLTRSILLILNEGRAEWFNHTYFVFLFLSFLYLPPSLVPAIVRPISLLSPAFHGSRWMLETWSHTSAIALHSGVLVIANVLAWATLLVGLRVYRSQILERSFR